MKRPLHLLIIGLLLAGFGGYTTTRLWSRTDLTAVGLLYSVPMLVFGGLLLGSWVFYPALCRKFSDGAIYAFAVAVTLGLGLLWFIWAMLQG